MSLLHRWGQNDFMFITCFSIEHIIFFSLCFTVQEIINIGRQHNLEQLWATMKIPIISKDWPAFVSHGWLHFHDWIFPWELLSQFQGNFPVFCLGMAIYTTIIENSNDSHHCPSTEQLCRSSSCHVVGHHTLCFLLLHSVLVFCPFLKGSSSFFPSKRASFLLI